MKPHPLEAALRQLIDEANALIAPELADSATLESLRPAALALLAHVEALRPALIDTPGDDYPELDYLWQMVAARLAYLLPAPTDPDDLGQNIQLVSSQALHFAKQAIDHQLNASEYDQICALLPRVNQLRSQIDPNDTDWQRLLSEARLELDFVLNGNRGAVSMRLGHYLRDLES